MCQNISVSTKNIVKVIHMYSLFVLFESLKFWLRGLSMDGPKWWENIKNIFMCSKDEQKCKEGEKMKTDF